MGNGNVHSADKLPTLLVGGAGGRVPGNRHIVENDLTPNANLLLSIAELYGVETTRFGVSTGRVSL
ncbi:hypothetical protein D3C83_102280 [compost metagenome]